VNARLPTMLCLALAAAGCAAPATDTKPEAVAPGVLARQPDAIDAALKRARADLACPQAQATVTRADRLRPTFADPKVTTPDRAQYLIEASGCGKRQQLRVICTQESTTACYVAEATTR
jgi:hypothetical protein